MPSLHRPRNGLLCLTARFGLGIHSRDRAKLDNHLTLLPPMVLTTMHRTIGEERKAGGGPQTSTDGGMVTVSKPTKSASVGEPFKGMRPFRPACIICHAGFAARSQTPSLRGGPRVRLGCTLA